MLRLRGKQADSARYFYRGFTYHRDGRNGAFIFRCASRNALDCGARLYSSSNIDLANAVFHQHENHNHEPDPLLPLKEQFTDEVTHLARTTFQDCKALFDIARMKPEYADIRQGLHYYNEFKTKMEKARKENIPPIPRNLLGLGDILQDYPPVNSIFRGIVRGADQSVALLFIHPTMLEALRECRQLFCDGTFKIRPRRPRSAQVFIIHFRKMNTGFPAVFAYTSAKTADMYDAIWDRLLQLVPELEQNIEGITADFEKAQIKSGKRKFPNARLSGCLFHFKQCLAKKWDRLNIPVQFEYILEKAYALAHLPADKMQEGIGLIEEIVNGLDDTVASNEVLGKLRTFAAYVRTFWLPLAPILSVNGKPVKTNNTAENFHLHARKFLGDRPNVYKELNDLTDLMNRQASDYEAVSAGARLSPHRPRALQTADLDIQHLEAEVALNRIPVADLLTRVAFHRRFSLSRVFWYNERMHQRQDAPEVNQPQNEIDPEGADDYGHFLLEQLRYMQENLHADPAPGGAFENEVFERRRGVDYVYRDEEQMPQPPGQPPANVARRRGRPRVRAAQNAPRARERPVERPRANAQHNDIGAVGDELDREVEGGEPEELMPERRAEPVRRGRGRPRIHPVREPPAAHAREMNVRGRGRRNALNQQVQVPAPNNERLDIVHANRAGDVAQLDEADAMERAVGEPDGPMPERRVEPVRRGRGRPRIHPIRERPAAHAVAINALNQHEDQAPAPNNEERDIARVEVVDLFDDDDIIPREVAPMENGNQIPIPDEERIMADLIQLVAANGPVVEPQEEVEFDAEHQGNEQQIVVQEEDALDIVIEGSRHEDVPSDVEEEIIERHILQIPGEARQAAVQHGDDNEIDRRTAPLEVLIAEQMAAHADDPWYDETEATIDAANSRPPYSPIQYMETEAEQIRARTENEDQALASEEETIGQGASALQSPPSLPSQVELQNSAQVQQADTENEDDAVADNQLFVSDEERVDQRDASSLRAPPCTPSQVQSEASVTVQQVRSYAALQKAKRRKRRWLESNPEMRTQKKSEQEKKREKNKKRKLNWIRKKNEHGNRA